MPQEMPEVRDVPEVPVQAAKKRRSAPVDYSDQLDPSSQVANNSDDDYFQNEKSTSGLGSSSTENTQKSTGENEIMNESKLTTSEGNLVKEYLMND